MKWGPQDVIACIIVVGCFTLLGMGLNTVISWALFGVVVSYYGIDLTPWIKLGRRQKTKEGSKE